jgi:hypothetical protein
VLIWVRSGSDHPLAMDRSIAADLSGLGKAVVLEQVTDEQRRRLYEADPAVCQVVEECVGVADGASVGGCADALPSLLGHEGLVGEVDLSRARQIRQPHRAASNGRLALQPHAQGSRASGAGAGDRVLGEVAHGRQHEGDDGVGVGAVGPGIAVVLGDAEHGVRAAQAPDPSECSSATYRGGRSSNRTMRRAPTIEL